MVTRGPGGIPGEQTTAAVYENGEEKGRKRVPGPEANAAGKCGNGERERERSATKCWKKEQDAEKQTYGGVGIPAVKARGAPLRVSRSVVISVVLSAAREGSCNGCPPSLPRT